MAIEIITAQLEEMISLFLVYMTVFFCMVFVAITLIGCMKDPEARSMQPAYDTVQFGGLGKLGNAGKKKDEEEEEWEDVPSDY